MKTLYEGLLDDMEDVLANTENDAMEVYILKTLGDETKYDYDKKLSPKKMFRIQKTGNKWIVDVKENFTVCGTFDGYVTDGTFEFGVAAKGFYIRPKDILSSSDEKVPLKSLKYCPKMVNHDFMIYNTDGLKNLKFCPKKVYGLFSVTDSDIDTLKWLPEYCSVLQIVNCKKLKSLDGAKCDVKDIIEIKKNGFTCVPESFKNAKIKLMRNSENTCYLDTDIYDCHSSEKGIEYIY